MGSWYSKNELRKFKQYKKMYMDEGYPAYAAEERAYDIIFAERKADVHQFSISKKLKKITI